MKRASSKRDQELLNILRKMESTPQVSYPEDLQAARRASFLEQVERTVEEQAAAQNQEVIHQLQKLGAAQAEYPAGLLAARRASFLEQVKQTAAQETEQQVSAQEKKLIRELQKLGSVLVAYPARLLAARRSAYIRQIAWFNIVRWWATLRQAPASTREGNPRSISSLLMAGSLALAAFAGYWLYLNNSPLDDPMLYQPGTVHSVQIISPDAREVRIICKPGAEPPLCLAGEYQSDDVVTVQKNGSARPAVAKDTKPDSALASAANVNDGLYGPGSRWVSNSRNSWIKIDLGRATHINTVKLGRDRLGKSNDGDPGQFVIAVALTDNVYADGNSSNDNQEYTPVFSSETAGFTGTIDGAETVTAQFEPQVARYIKVTFENKGAAIDEVEALMVRPPLALGDSSATPRKKPEADTPPPAASNPTNPSSVNTLAPESTATPVPTNTPLPTSTAIPSSTPLPTSTATAVPTATAIPTNTPVPTSTPIPTSTFVPTLTPTSLPSNTPPPTRTPIPEPTDTPIPPNTGTPVPLMTEPTTEDGMPTQSHYYNFLTRSPFDP